MQIKLCSMWDTTRDCHASKGNERDRRKGKRERIKRQEKEKEKRKALRQHLVLVHY